MAVDKVLCLITGPSGSGKTSVASKVKERLLTSVATTCSTDRGSKQRSIDGGKLLGPRSSRTESETRPLLSVVVIHQDNYFTKPFLSYEERVDDSYENGSGIDWERLVSDVRSELGDGEAAGSGIETGPKVVIVEGHLLGDATILFREKIFSCQNYGILGVFLVGCSQELCKNRRLARKKDRSDDERKNLSKYIDAFVWPSFLVYGVNAMETLRQDLDAENTNEQNSTTKALEINNAESASLEQNADEIWNWIHNMLSA